MQQHRQTGIRLPKALREELNLDDRGAPKTKKKGGAPIRQDRKELRKQKRLDKKKPKLKHPYRAPHGREEEEEGVGDKVDPFDISDPSDIEELMKGASKPPKKSKNSRKTEPEVDPFDISDPSDLEEMIWKKKKPEPKPEMKPKPILKTTKRKATEEPEVEIAPPKRKHSKAVLDRMAQDEAEIAYLEKKLKIKSGKIPKSMQDDGLDFLLEGLKDNYLDDRKERAAKKNRQDAKKARKLEGGDGSEDSGLDDLMGDLDGSSDEDGEDEDGEDEDGEGEDDEGSDVDANEELNGLSETEEEETEAAPPRVRENPYRPGISKSVTTDEVKPASKYIPPSLRQPVSTESERMTRLRRQVQGLINRLSEVKLVAILGDFEELYRMNPRADVTSILTEILVATLCDPSVLNDTYHILHGGFLAGLYKILGTDVGATVVQRIVEEFLVQHERANGITDPSTASKECTNIMSFLSELYNFQVVGCVLIFDFIRMFLSELTELHTELLLKIVRNAGPQLRSDDPTALKSLVALLQPAITKAGGTEKLSVRTKFMIETLTNLKNNRLKSSTANSVVTTEHTIRMKKLLGTLNTRMLRATEPLHASLDDIRNTETKGKWWLVGASWAGAPAAQPAPDTTKHQNISASAYVSDGEDDAGMPDLQALARQHRMNTDIRRAIFITLLSSSDFTDAHTRLSKLRLKRTQEREIPRVLLHCAAAEGTYNPYYTLIAKKLCTSHPLKMTFTFALWDYFRRFGEDDGSGSSAKNDDDEDEDSDDDEGLGADQMWRKPAALRKIVNLAKLYAALVAAGSLQILIFKTLNWSYLQSPTRGFLEVFFTTLMGEVNGDEWEVAAMFGRFAENIELVRGIRWFLKKRVKDGGVAASEEERTVVKRGVKAAMKTLDGILKTEVAA